MATSVARFGVPVLVTTSMAAVLAATVMTTQTPQRQTRQAVFVPTAFASSSNCDPNYEGACVPIARDVDCEGGSGNGPAYVSGPLRVVGDDIYKLDADKDGIGCE